MKERGRFVPCIQLSGRTRLYVCVCTRKYATQQATCPCTAGRGKRASACVRARFRKWVGHAGLHAEGESIDVRCILPLFLPFSATPRTPFSLTTDDSTFARKRPLLDVQLLFSCTSFMLFPLKGCNSPRFFFFCIFKKNFLSINLKIISYH